MMGSSLGYGQVIRDIPAQKKPTAKEQMKGWSTIFDWGSDKWLVWKAETPILESRAYKKSRILGSADPVTGKCDYLEYHAGSFYLMENSIIITTYSYQSFTGSYTSSTGGYFYYDYDGQNYRKKKWVNFAKYQNNTRKCYNNEKDVVEWLKRELKNKNAIYAPVKLVIDDIITYDLYPYSDMDYEESNMFLYSLPDNSLIKTIELDNYPTPISSQETIKDYVSRLVNNKGYVSNNGNILQGVNEIYLEFIIDSIGQVKNLTIDGGRITRHDADRETDFDSEFNNWLAEIINNIKFHPGTLNGKTVNTYCCFKFNYNKNPYIIDDRGIYMIYDGNHWGFGYTEYGYSLIKKIPKEDTFIYDTIIKRYNDYETRKYEVIKEGKHGLVYFYNDHKKAMYIPMIYDTIERIDSYILAVNDDGLTIYDQSCKLVINNLPKDGKIEIFDQDHYGHTIWKITNNTKCGLVENSGKIILPCEYDIIERLSIVVNNHLHVFIYLKQGNKHGIINYNSFGNIYNPQIWFKDIDFQHNNMLHQGTHEDLDYTFWVKLFDSDNLWSLVKIDKISGEFTILVDSKYDAIISDYIVLIKDKKYIISITNDGKVKKKRIK